MTTLGLPGIHVPTAGEADSDDQYTPRWLLDMIGKFWSDSVSYTNPFGYETDPCWSSESASRAAVTYDGSGSEQDGLSMPWFGHAWVNGPYSNLGPWADRAAVHCATTGYEALFLANVSTSVQWFRRVRPGQPQGCRAVAFFDRRISFIKDGVERRGNDREQMMLWWGPATRLRTFRRVFGRVAWIAT